MLPIRPLLLLVLVGALLQPFQPTQPTAAATPIAAPLLKWQRGGCFASWCQTGWYASPAVADLNNDGQNEVVWASYDAVALNGATGELMWRAPNTSRAWPGIVVADLNNDRQLEVVVGRGNDQLTVYGPDGRVRWERRPFGVGEVRSLATDDLNGDGTLEVVVGRGGVGATKQVSVYSADGQLRPGWPARRDGELGYGWGMYNQNLAVADLNNDGRKEIYAPTDTHYITALDLDGNQLPVHARYTGRRFWSQVGVHVDDAVDLRGYANCGREHRPNFANSAPAAGDLDGDGTHELVVVGNVYDCAADPYKSLYEMPFVLNGDRSRWQASGFDWTALPAPEPGSAPRSEDYNVIQSHAPNAVLADLDGDGRKEILYPSYDGRLHAYWLDKTQRGNWPFVVPGAGLRFAGEPVVADLDADGKAEVLLTSWPQNGGGRVGQLHILDWQGRQLHAIDLPAPASGGWNGGLGAPTIANLDGDPELELVVGTVSSGVVAYDLPGSARALVLWGTGRGSLQRTGVAPRAESSWRLEASPVAQTIARGGTARYTLSVGGSVAGDVALQVATLPAGFAVTLTPTTLASPGSATLLVTDTRTRSPVPPGVLVRLPLVAEADGVTRTLEVQLLVGGSAVYQPALLR